MRMQLFAALMMNGSLMKEKIRRAETGQQKGVAP
jgi:hypothetical protein